VFPAAQARTKDWSDCFVSDARNAAKDDLAFIDAVIDHAIATRDPERVYAARYRGNRPVPTRAGRPAGHAGYRRHSHARPAPRPPLRVTQFRWGEAEWMPVGRYRIDAAGQITPSHSKRYPAPPG
jgi:hypothetical protein